MLRWEGWKVNHKRVARLRRVLVQTGKRIGDNGRYGTSQN